MPVEHAFGRLKARFKHLQMMDMDRNHVCLITTAACILHNMCEELDHPWPEEWIDPEEPGLVELRDEVVVHYEEERNGQQIRELLMEQFVPRR